MCYDIFASFWLKNVVCKVYVAIWRNQIISLSTLSETDSYKLRNKFAKFRSFYKMCTIISPFLPTIIDLPLKKINFFENQSPSHHNWFNPFMTEAVII